MNTTLRHADAAIDSALAFLGAQLCSGAFGLACVGSDGTPRFSHEKGHVFTGFFLAEALAGRLTELDRTLLLVRILSEENDGLWGFSPPAPFISPEHEVFIVDADDTAYVLRTLRRLGVNRSPRRLLVFHRANVNAFVTFNAPGDTELVTEPRVERNLLAHPEVNANVFLALQGTNLESYVNYDLVWQTQAQDGHWPAYFYPSPFFATALFLAVLDGRDGFSDVRRRARTFLLDSQNDDGGWGEPSDPFDSALALDGLMSAGEQGASLERGIGFLMAHMSENGSWHTTRCVWAFHADPADVWQAFDAHGTLVSALCTRALRRAVAVSRES